MLLSERGARRGGVGAVFPVNERRGGGGPGKKGPRSTERRKKEGGGTIPDCGGALPGQEPPGNDHGCVQLRIEDNKPRLEQRRLCGFIIPVLI